MNVLVLLLTFAWIAAIGGLMFGYLEGKLKEWSKWIIILFAVALILTFLALLVPGSGNATMN